VYAAESKRFREKQAQYPALFGDHRNFVLGLCADGVTPFEFGNNDDSLFYVILINYNLPTELRMQAENIILFGIGAGKPKSSQQVYDVLVNQLLELWDGKRAWDSLSDEKIKMKAILLNAVMDYPGLTDFTMQMPHSGLTGCVKCNMRGTKPLTKVVHSRRVHDEEMYGPVQPRTDASLRASAHQLKVTPCNTTQHTATHGNTLHSGV
jgi:hypothetical protein